jgi:hypothetical protein
MLADRSRSRTVKEHLKSLKHLATMFPLAAGPADITDRVAGDFKTKYAAGLTVRNHLLKPGEQASAHMHRPASPSGSGN